MLAVLQQLTFGGATVYTGFIQVDDHQGIPVLEPAVGKGGMSRDTPRAAAADVRKRRLAVKAQRFPRPYTRVAVIRSKLTDRVVFAAVVRLRVSSGVTFYGPVIQWTDTIEAAILGAKKPKRKHRNKDLHVEKA